MYIILVYDVGENRVQKVHKLLKRYLHWVQNSVFEGELSLGSFEAMKMELKMRMKADEDSIIIYTLGSLKYTGREIMGVEKNLTGNIFEVDDLGGDIRLVLKNLILPALTLAIRPLSVIMQLSRNSLLDVLSQDYIRTAWSKGLSYSRIIYRHALRNALNPVVTAVSGWFASLMAGVIFVEYIFGWKGLGFVIVNALNNYDFPLVLGSVVFISLSQS